ncbi:tumor necrosis factor ligand superfamily member 15-like [Babylonia areolata]|uniref:tumor necrosis factor ligand superfamily member 15-like n=1 Tax=Babylonia areolata TaxID=304850 RepID=UPI003FD5FA88
MNPSQQSSSSRSLSDSSTNGSTHYADVESASNFDLISSMKNTSVSSSTFAVQKRSSSAAKMIAIASLFVSVFCLLCVVALGCWVFLFSDDDNKTLPFQSRLVEEKSREVCMPCLQVSPDPLDSSSGSAVWDDLTVRDDEENETKICCAVNAAQYAALFKLILQRQQEVQNLADYLAGSNDTGVTEERFPVAQRVADPKEPVSAHLLFKPSWQRTAELEDSKVQQWKSPAESPLSHVTRGLKFHKLSRLLVQTPGLYYVYSQLLFNPSPSPADDTSSSDVTGLKRHVISSYVRRVSILHPVASGLLLKSRHTRGDPAKDRHSSYVGGVFRLYQGDWLDVQVSQPDLISNDDVASFFGLFRVGP